MPVTRFFMLQLSFDKQERNTELMILEFDNSYVTYDSVFGIANVQSGVCKLTIEYFLSDTQLTVLLPESCYFCQKSNNCSREFGEQIIRKLNAKDKGKVTYLLR
jgi:hypothetical protein